MLRWRQGVVYWLLFCITYFMLAVISMETRDPWSLSTAIGLPTGLVLGALCTCPRTYWPIWGVGAGLMHILVSMLYGRTVDVALVFALLDLAVLFPLAMMWHSVWRYLGYVSYRRATFLLLSGVYIVSLIGGLINTFALILLDYPVVFSHFFTWSLANAAGCLSVAPFLITHNLFKEEKTSITFNQVALLLPVLIFLLPPFLLESELLRQILLYVVLGSSLMLAMVWPFRELTLYLFFLTLLVSLATLYGYGPLVEMGGQGLQFSQLYLVVVISLGLLVAAHEKEHGIRSDAQRLQLLSHLLHPQSPVFFRLADNGVDISWLCKGMVFDIAVEQIPTLQLFQARIHPEDRAQFSASLSAGHASPGEFGQCTLRLLLTDCHYHPVSCNLVYSHAQSGTLGVLILSG
ncbi:MASE1 domain-containing protein [Pectobacterium parmentieri]|nr:MASE1 domain-containing protein [Pectobacterium parmentieri]AFI89643.1 Hypothetical protein W5S_1551 [Pectobacterium parmentieri]